MTAPIQIISLSGSPAEIGFRHGKLLSKQIRRNIEFYKPLFLNNLESETKVLDAAERLKAQIADFNPNYKTEIDHVALGAEVSEPLWLYALNSRTELALTQDFYECTAIVFPRHYVIGQTWDWAQGLEDNFVVMEIEFPSGHKILQMTEAGIIGKIGLNNCGLGVTLNILWIEDKVLSGLPIHIVLRAILESRTLKEAISNIDRSGGGKASNIIISQGGQAYDVEFFGHETHYHDIKDEIYTHTNHYLHSGNSIQLDVIDRANSISRYIKAVEELSNVKDFSTAEMISILSDQSGGDNSILATYKIGSKIGMGCWGTLATIVMDLDNGTMHVRKGNPSSPSFSVEKFAEFHMV